jgi:hypothetical protein
VINNVLIRILYPDHLKKIMLIVNVLATKEVKCQQNCIFTAIQSTTSFKLYKLPNANEAKDGLEIRPMSDLLGNRIGIPK